MSERKGKSGSVLVSVVCPFFNEASILEDAVPGMIESLRDSLDAWELILVNDGSTDGSLEMVQKALDPDDERVRVLSYSENQGRGHALKCGMDAAHGAIIVTTEIDCSWGDDIAARLVAELDEHPDTDFVVASPHMKGGGLENIPPLRRLLSRWGNAIIRVFFASHITMNTGMTRAYRSAVIKPLVVSEFEKEFHLEVLLKLLTIGFKAREIPATISWREQKKDTRVKRRSSTRINKTIATHLRFLVVANPVRYFSVAAAVSFIVGSLFVGTAIWNFLTSGPSVFLALIGLIMLLFCLVFTGFAVLFVEYREVMREQWFSYYPPPLPPNRKPAMVVFPPGR